MAINRYQGNSGKVTRIAEPPDYQPKENIKVPEIVQNFEPRNTRPPMRRATYNPNNFGGLSNIFSSISGKTSDIIGDIIGTKTGEKPIRDSENGGLLSKFTKIELDTDDLIILLIIWLMYRDSHDEELLIVMAVILFS